MTNQNMKTVLITGSNGMLGQKLVYALLNQYPDCHIIATSSGPNRLNLDRGYVYETLDISNRNEVISMIQKYRPSAVINTAAITNVDACELNQELCRKVNILGVEHLIDALEELASETYRPHLVHISTDFVFDGEAGPYAEDDIPNPLSYYALSKYESEKKVINSNLDWSILRTIIVYGVADNMARSNLVLWAKSALEKKQDIKVINDQYRAPTLAEDLADACLSAIHKKALGIFHVSGMEIQSILELVYAVADYFSLDKSFIKPISSEALKQPAKRPLRTGFVLDKAVKVLNYHPHSFREGLQIIEKQLEERRKNTL